MKSLFYILLFTGILTTSCATKVVVDPKPDNKTVVVKKVPNHHKVVFVNGRKYYKWNGVYHRKTARGYIVVKI